MRLVYATILNERLARSVLDVFETTNPILLGPPRSSEFCSTGVSGTYNFLTLGGCIAEEASSLLCVQYCFCVPIAEGTPEVGTSFGPIYTLLSEHRFSRFCVWFVVPLLVLVCDYALPR